MSSGARSTFLLTPMNSLPPIFDRLPKLTVNSPSHGRYESDRVTDNTARWLYAYRVNSPRQRRLAAKRRALFASYHEAASILAGILILAAIVLILFFLA